jgi:hypothetical protein
MYLKAMSRAADNMFVSLYDPENVWHMCNKFRATCTSQCTALNQLRISSPVRAAYTLWRSCENKLSTSYRNYTINYKQL